MSFNLRQSSSARVRHFLLSYRAALTSSSGSLAWVPLGDSGTGWDAVLVRIHSRIFRCEVQLGYKSTTQKTIFSFFTEILRAGKRLTTATVELSLNGLGKGFPETSVHAMPNPNFQHVQPIFGSTTTKI